MRWRLYLAIPILTLLAPPACPPARAGSGVATSPPSVLDARGPRITLLQPPPGQLLLIGTEYEFQWTIVEEHFAEDPDAVRFEVLAGGVPLFAQDLPASADGNYSLLWTVSADSSLSAQWRVSGVDLYGNAGEALSQPFLISDGMTVVPEAVPRVLALARNYPNPFNPRTRIEFALPGAGPVRLSIHDVRGRRVALLLDGEMPAGRHAVSWDARGFSSGLYFARLAAVGQVLTRKLVLLQ